MEMHDFFNLLALYIVAALHLEKNKNEKKK
jgi:hypothetical protein